VRSQKSYKSSEKRQIPGVWYISTLRTFIFNFRPLRTYFEEEAATSTPSVIHHPAGIDVSECAKVSIIYFEGRGLSTKAGGPF
jgi:hypothetical protein